VVTVQVAGTEVFRPAILARCARPCEPTNPHALRHSFCKSLVDAGTSLDGVTALAGHAGLNTAARYTRPTCADLEREVKKLEWMRQAARL
jgi:site-specific recombinase XerD